MGAVASKPAGRWATTPATPSGRSTGGWASVVVAVQAGLGSTGTDASRSIGAGAPTSVVSSVDTPVAWLFDTACAWVRPHVAAKAAAKKIGYGVMPILERRTESATDGAARTPEPTGRRAHCADHAHLTESGYGRGTRRGTSLPSGRNWMPRLDRDDDFTFRYAGD